MLIRWRLNQPPQIEDGLLFLACVCLTGETILLYIAIPNIYFVQGLSKGNKSEVSLTEIVEKINWFQKADSAFLVITWITIFLVKFSYLCFFRRLINRLGQIIRYWKVVIIFNIIAFIFCIIDSFVNCPKKGLSASE